MVANVTHSSERTPRCTRIATSSSSRNANTIREYPRALVEYSTNSPDVATSAAANSAGRAPYIARDTMYVAGTIASPATKAGRRRAHGVLPNAVIAAFASKVWKGWLLG